MKQFPGLVSPLGGLAAVLCLLSAEATAADRRIEVAAGEWDRRHTVVETSLPAAIRPPAQLVDEAGGKVDLQLMPGGEAWFVVDNLPKGTTRTYRIAPLGEANRPANRVAAEKKDGRIDFSAGQKPVFSYQAEESELPRPDIKPLYKRGGYIHPVRTPGGKIVTDDYPPNHIHHHGIWSPWTKTEFEGRHPDFWNMGDGTGKVEFVALDSVWSGAVCGGFTSRHLFVDLTAPKPVGALNERWRGQVYAAGDAKFNLFDLASTQTCATPSPLKLLEYRYGGLGFRGRREWNGATKTLFLTSEGETDRVKGNTTRARWCYVGGEVDGGQAGVAIFCHPGNFRFPQPMRLHPDEPFFNFAPSQAGDFLIKPGAPYVAKYRFAVFEGAPDKAELERLWHDYAEPPKVKVLEP